jgi:DNA-binding LytR/AlgR family response regulator
MSQKLKTIIVEDEPLAREGLTSYIREIHFLDLVATCESALEANSTLKMVKPDLMFLDIQMPKLSGIDFLKSLNNPPMVIFTTAYPNYALQGFELDVVDYLVKPYPFERFLKAVNKAKDLQTFNQPSFNDVSNAVVDHTFIKTDNKYERINFDDILFVEGMENYVAIHTSTERFITLMTMKSIEELLPASGFLRIHKTYIIALQKVRAIEGNQVNMGKKKLPISRQRRNEILDIILKK